MELAWNYVKDKFAVHLSWDPTVEWEKLAQIVPNKHMSEYGWGCYIERYADRNIWEKIYAGDKHLYCDLISDITEPLMSEYCYVDWDCREFLIKNAAVLMYLRPEEQEEYLSIYLDIFYYGSRYIEDGTVELEPIKDILSNYDIQLVLELFGEDVVCADNIDNWVDVNEDVFIAFKGLKLLMPHMKATRLVGDQFNLLTDGCRLLTSQSKRKINQMYTILNNYDKIDY